MNHRSAEILCSLANSQYLNGEYSNAISSFEKVKENFILKILKILKRDNIFPNIFLDD